MSRYAKPLVKDEERELRLAIMRLELRELLWRQVSIPDAMVHLALGLGGDSSWQSLKAAGEAPPRVTINQRVFVLTSDLRAWLESREKTTATRGQRRNAQKDEQHAARDDDEPNARAPTSTSFAGPLPAAR